MLNKKAPVYIVILMTLAGSASTYCVTSVINKRKVQAVADEAPMNCNYTISRLSGYEFVSPVLFREESCQSQQLAHVRSEIESLVETLKTSGTITAASVYLRKLNKGEWIATGEEEIYSPGSLMKVPELITFLKMNEKNPGLLEKKIHYKTPLVSQKNAQFVSKSIVPGNVYTIRELLYYMIAYSDNNATMVLNQMMDINIFKKLFTDFGMPAPDMNAKDIPITARQFSLFMRSIYNANYLSTKDSEYCAELLSHTDFADGLIQGLPKNLKVAHKFGEAGDPTNNHFSESGIVYIQNAPYLLTVMTKGREMKALPAVVSRISNNVYNMMNGM